MTVLIVGIVSFNSCKKSPDITTTQAPAIHFLTGAGLTSGNVTVGTGAQLSFGITASARMGKLNRYLVQRKFDNTTTTAKDISFSATGLIDTLTVPAAASAGQETWNFRIFDDNGNSAAISLVITTTPGQPPTIHFLTGAGLTSGDVTVNTATQLSFGITATAATGKLTQYLVRRIFNGMTTTVLDTIISTSNYSETMTETAQPSAGAETWVFTIFDDTGDSAAISLVVTTIAVITWGPISTYSNTILGSFNSIVGSAFASSNGTVYTITDAKTNCMLIDWLYYYGATNFGTIAAPNDVVAGTIFVGANGLSTWSHLNATVFKKVTDVISNWDGITNDSLVLIETQTGVTATSVTSLAVNDILAFITEPGKKGLLQVTTIDPGTAGTITYNVKVQK